MKPIVTSLITLLILLSPFMNVFSQDMTAKQIVEKADKKTRGLSMKADMDMTIVRPGWERTVSMKSWSKDTDRFLIYITAPAKEKGQVFLKVGKEMWNYVPTISRMIKIPPSMMMQSWMGSDFTNDDLVKQSSIVVDYTHKLNGEETVRDQNCYVIELTPKEDAAVVWGKIICWITKDGFYQWKNEYYDEDGVLINIENGYDIKDFGDRKLPAKFEMIPVDEEGRKTIMVVNSAEYNLDIQDSFFSKQNMKRVR